MLSTYEALGTFLSAQRPDRVTMKFAEIERILGRPLPSSARRHRGWWSSRWSSHRRAWAWTGWRVTGCSLSTETVTFLRLQTQEPRFP